MAILGSTDLGDGRLYLTVDHDPTSTSTDCLAGSLVYSTSTSKLYEKTSDGDNTDVAEKDDATDPRTDNDAIHDNVANEFDALTEKASPSGADLIIIEDAGAAGAKKKAQVGNLPTGGGGEANTASNVGSGADIFKQKTGIDLEFRGVNAASAKISAAVNGDNIDIDVPDATTTTKGAVELATDGENAANVVVQGNDARLSDARTPTGAAGGDLGGTYPNPTVDDGADGTAIHDNVAAEISAITEKTTPVSADLLLIEDSAAANAKKKVQIGNLPGGGGTVRDTCRFVLNGKPRVETGIDGAFIVPNAGTIKSVTLWRRTAGSSGSTIIDVNKNGTTIFTTQGNRPTVTSGGGNNATDRATDMNVTTVAQGDRIEVDVDAIEGGNPLDLAVTFEVEYT